MFALFSLISTVTNQKMSIEPPRPAARNTTTTEQHPDHPPPSADDLTIVVSHVAHEDSDMNDNTF